MHRIPAGESADIVSQENVAHWRIEAGVGSRDDVTLFTEQNSEGTHAGATNAEEMKTAWLLKDIGSGTFFGSSHFEASSGIMPADRRGVVVADMPYHVQMNGFGERASVSASELNIYRIRNVTPWSCSLHERFLSGRIRMIARNTEIPQFLVYVKLRVTVVHVFFEK